MLLLAGMGFVASADEDIRSTQEELRRRNIYFGEVDGRSSPELQEALKRYQKRKGLAASGESDRDTLRSLGIVARAPGEPLPKDVALPDEPVLKSDTRINVTEEAQEIAANTGISVASLALEKTGGAPRGSRSGHGAATGLVDAPTGGSAPRASHFSIRDDARLRSEVQQYVHDYLKAVGGNHLQDELRFYADRVDYLGNGRVDRRLIESSLRKYYQRWPHRNYTSVGNIDYHSLPARGEIVVRFQTAFNLRNGATHAHGRSENEMVINAATADPRVVSISERRVRL
jgi:peptidoglycan hydrolase-like protein with peptidoglycan-binding domain